MNGDCIDDYLSQLKSALPEGTTFLVQGRFRCNSATWEIFLPSAPAKIGPVPTFLEALEEASALFARLDVTGRSK